MNGEQRIVLLAAMLVIVAMCVYPPWVLEYAGTDLSLGYSLITEPPTYIGSSASHATLDQKRLAAQFAIAGVAGVALMWILKGRKTQSPQGAAAHWRTM